jgi:hypothetical protein
MVISPVSNPTLINATINSLRHLESDNLQSVHMKYDLIKDADIKFDIQKVVHTAAIANRLAVDIQNTDPFWINNVNYVASYSKHNYNYMHI